MGFNRRFMEWSRIEVESAEENGKITDSLHEYSLGLDGDAEASHREFIASTESFSNLRKKHMEFLEKGVQNIENSRENSREIHSINTLVDIFEGEWNSSEISLPIETLEPEKIILEKAELSGIEYIRLIIPEKFGGIINTFGLPDGASINSAEWNQGKLKLFFED